MKRFLRHIRNWLGDWKATIKVARNPELSKELLRDTDLKDCVSLDSIEPAEEPCPELSQDEIERDN